LRLLDVFYTFATALFSEFSDLARRPLFVTRYVDAYISESPFVQLFKLLACFTKSVPPVEIGLGWTLTFLQGQRDLAEAIVHHPFDLTARRSHSCLSLRLAESAITQCPPHCFSESVLSREVRSFALWHDRILASAE